MYTKDNMKYIDLFAGTGAFSHVLGKKGFQCVFANDVAESSQEIYHKNHGGHPFVLSNLNDIDVHTIPKHDLLCAGFPCFVEGTMVLTKNGYKPIQEVSLGEKLLTHTGIFQSIVNSQTKLYVGKLYHLVLKYHPDPIVCTEDHPFFVRTKQRKWNNSLRRYEYTFNDAEWKKASEITHNDYFGMVINAHAMTPTFTFDQHLTITLDNMDMWFMIGYFVGDGWIDGDCMNKISFAMSDKEEEYVVQRISNILDITDEKCDSDKCKKFGCRDEVWCSILQNFGKTGFEKKIPEWVQDAPVEYIKEFLHGYLCANVTTVSQDLALGLQRLYLKSGQIVSIDKIVNERPCYRVRNILDPTKNKCAFLESGYAWFPQKKDKMVEQTTDTMVYNFEVEHDNSYIVSNTIVHNCQPFSIAGKREGFNDPRSNVFWKILEIVQYHCPSILLLENVKNLKTHDDGKTFTTISSSLSNLGYHIKYDVLDTSQITHVPHHRERIYIVAFRDKNIYERFQFNFDAVDNNPISSFLEKTIPSKYYYTSKLRVFPVIQASVTKPVMTTNTVYQYRRHYVRENKKKMCPTLTANMGAGGHNVPLILDAKGIRKLTPRECFNLQGFPTDYVLPEISDSSLYKLAGNAVSVPVVELIVENLIQSF